MPERSYHRLSNEELMQYVIEHCDKPEAAQLLRTRWMDFWEHVQNKFGVKSNPDDILKLKRQIEYLRGKIHTLDDKIQSRQEELAKVEKAKLFRLQRQVYFEKSLVKRAKNKNDALRRQMKKVELRMEYYEELNQERLDAENLVGSVQRQMIRENLQCIDRHMHRLALVEAGLLDYALTIPGKNNGTPIES